MAGPALAEILRTRQPGLGVVFISGFPEGHLPDPLPPRTRFLSKPFQREDLLAAVLSVAS
jgi:two-component system cell cycle sensor histidine kinase/response regulator CckA